MTSKQLIGTLESYVYEKKDELVSSLLDFLRFKSISTQNIGMEECAQYLKDTMEQIGITTKMLRLEEAFPAVYGELLNPTATKTLLIYGHYDVQPPDPVELWENDPFDPVIKDGTIYARGATDDKGNLWATVMAIKCLVDNQIELPINVKFFFEGEEEIGSPNMKAYLEEYNEFMVADYTILCDRGIHESGRPQIYLGNKGIMNMEVTLTGAKRDVHSGQAPLIPNPAWQLIWLLNKLKNDKEEILVPGYYDKVIQPSEDDLELLKNIPFDKDDYLKTYEISDIIPKNDGIDALIWLLYNPTVTINGLTSGYQDEGNKTIVPNKASAKLDLRFVNNQDPEECAEMVRNFFKENYDGKIEVKLGDIRNPAKVQPSEEIVKIAIESSKEVYGEEPVVWPFLDGSGPLSLFDEIISAPAIIIGLGAPFSYANTHAPNENISIDQYLKGIKLMATIFSRYTA
jgi:acetylornithine deacetylase/succinyl-diaminopimelate desuccinylase-like protein